MIFQLAARSRHLISKTILFKVQISQAVATDAYILDLMIGFEEWKIGIEQYLHFI